MPTILSTMSSMVCVRASSWDTQKRLSYNPNAPRNPTKKSTIISTEPNNLPPLPSPTTSPSSFTLTAQSVSNLLERNTTTTTAPQDFPNPAIGVMKKLDDTYLGYERWMPIPPKVEKPRSVYNAATLAYIGDSIYELYARRHFLFPPLSIEEYNDRVMAVVRCEAQGALLQKLLSDNFLSKEERDVLRWGKNIASAKTRTKKRAGAAVYNRASSLETLVGYLYLTNVTRLEEVMLKLGFSTDSTQVPLEEADSDQAK